MKTKIKIDHTKCTKPEDCRKCLQVCPPAIFIINSPEKYSNDPKEWRIDVVFTDLCTKCYECINVCPMDAIEIK
jgi:ferredoxin